jgi:heat shock protein HtpX
LVNIVEEMQLAAGLPALPRIYLIDDPAPNAFAMGTRPDNWAVAVTTGLLHRLNRDELQGVIAHEIGHLKNRDVQFMTQAAVMLGSIIILSEIVWRSMRHGGRSRRRDDSRGGGGGQAQLIFFLVAILFAILGPLVAQLLYFSCSRKREYLADASGALYTRYPEGLAAALEKIAGSRTVPAFAGKAIAPLFIVNPLAAAGQSASLFATHPPTTERVRILRGMTGASFAAYEEAYRTATGKGILGAETLRTAEPAPLRAAGPTGPVTPSRDIRDLNYRTHGYRQLRCSCGMEINVPPGYEATTIRCVRCRTPIPVSG